MFTAWIVTAVIIAACSLAVVAGNVFQGYQDGGVDRGERRSIRFGLLGLLLSPTGFFIIPLAVVCGILYVLFKLFKGVIIFGFAKEPVRDKPRFDIY